MGEISLLWKYLNFCSGEEAESDATYGLGDTFSTYIEQFLCILPGIYCVKKICAPKMSWLLTHSLEWASQIKPRYE